MVDDNCPLCQLVSGGQLTDNAIEMELRGEIFVNRPLIEKAKRDIMEAMEKAEIRPEIIYAFDKTGLFSSEDQLEKFSEADIQESEEAIEQHRIKKS